jgi:hypothetical protein
MATHADKVGGLGFLGTAQSDWLLIRVNAMFRRAR